MIKKTDQCCSISDMEAALSHSTVVHLGRRVLRQALDLGWPRNRPIYDVTKSLWRSARDHSERFRCEKKRGGR